MTEQFPLCQFEASPAAAESLDRLRAEHGEIILHIPGGAEAAGTPICLPAGELRIGVRDVFLGRVHGVEVYEQAGVPGEHFRAGWRVRLDLVPGLPVGFSLIPAEGMQFVIRDSAR